MKRLLVICILLFYIKCADAQVAGEGRIQLANEIGFGTNLYGFGLSGEYFIIDRLSIVPSAIVLLPETGKATSLDLNVRYYLTRGVSQLYGMGGFNHYRRRLELAPTEENLINVPGLNIGLGYVYRLSEEFSVDSNLRIQPQNNNNVVFGIGIIYHIN